MSNIIQIKRSTSSATPGSLANGELAFTSLVDVLYIGSPNGSVVAIGGARTPGILTANQALVANSSGSIDEIRTANLVPTKIYANGAFGTTGQTLTSNSSGGVYWATPDPSVAGSDTQIQFNDGGSLAGDSGLTYNKTTDTLLVANTVNALAFTIGSWFVANQSGVFSSGVVNADIVSVGTSFKANTTQVTIGTSTKLSANGSVGTAGQVLASNGTSVYWADAGGTGTVTSVDSGSGLTGGPITGTGTLSVLANSGIIANTSGLFVRAGTGVTVNSTGVHIGQDVGTTAAVSFGSISVSGNAALGDSSSDVVSLNGTVNTSIMPTANTTYNIGNNTMRWAEIHAANVHSNTGYFDGSVQISGNLSVLGTTFTVSSNNLIIDDSMIQLAANNTTSDLLDIGFFGSYNPDNGAHEHAGLFRDATDDTFKLFKGLQESPTNTVNTGGTGYTMATLQSYLVSGALTTNSTNLSITANSTVSVALVANTLSLTTALLGTSGGTGRSTSTNNALLVGNSTNGYDVLNLGTSGYVLQSNGTALVYDVLDGGTF